MGDARAKAGADAGPVECPTCHGGGRVDRQEYASRVDIAFLEKEIPPSYFRRLAAKLRELKHEKASGEGSGNARLGPALDVAGGIVMRTEFTTTHKDGK